MQVWTSRQFVVPAVTSSPVRKSFGNDSPVSVEVSIDANAESSFPSAGIASPAETKTIIRLRKELVATFSRLPSISTVAVSGMALSSARTESVALFLALTSMYRPSNTTDGTTAAVSK
jgi:hypothetical protein